VADVREDADEHESGRRMQPYRRSMAGIANHRNHLTETSSLAFLNQRCKQGPADTLAPRLNAPT
jgi:hypothetical protein